MPAENPQESTPFEHVQGFATSYLTTINTVMLPFATVATLLDFLGNQEIKAIVQGASIVALVSLVMLAATKKLRPPLHRRPAFQVLAVLLVLLIPFMSVSRANQGQGGALSSWQKALVDMADNAKNPRAILTQRGYQLTSGGLLEAIKQHDHEAVSLFAAAKLRVDSGTPLVLLLDQYWDPKIASLLTEEMFADESACFGKGGASPQELMMYYGLYPKNLRPDQPEKATTFKRLCKSNKIRDALEKRVANPDPKTPPETIEQYRWALAYLNK
jgi:hypothetical protein